MNKKLLETLQIFHDADDGANGGGTPPNPDEGKKDDDPETVLDIDGLSDEQLETIKEKFGLKDDNDVNNIVKSKHARWKTEEQKAVEEAKKLAKMNADEKETYEREQLEKELEEYKRKDQFYSMSREASKMLAEHDIQADDDLLQIVVKDDAEGTQTAVNAFVELVNAKVEQGVKKALSGRTPKANVNTSKDTNKPGTTPGEIFRNANILKNKGDK